MKSSDSIRYRIAVVGAGGTGSHFVARFSQFLATFSSDRIATEVVLIDGDVVEEKNLERQVFVAEDVLSNKAEALAKAVFETYGLEFLSFPKYLDTDDDLADAFSTLSDKVYAGGKSYQLINVLIGCCDNHRCRQVMEAWFKKQTNAIYIDAANEFSEGEVVTAIKVNSKLIAPPRSFYFPEVLKAKGKRRSEESCGVVNKTAPQHLATNAEAANIMLAIMSQLFSSGKIAGGVVYFDTFGFSKVFRRYEGGVTDDATN